jgi:hypothetical protein
MILNAKTACAVLIAALMLACGMRAREPAPRSRVRNVRLAIVLCKFRDKPVELRPRSFYEDFYTRRGTGGAARYWFDVTFGGLDLSQSKVFGWFTMRHDSSEVSRLVFPGGRNTLVQWGRDAAAENGVDLGKFDGVIVVQNWGPDHGAAGNGMVIVDRLDIVETTFITHEMGHLLGLPHSFGNRIEPCITAHGEYCDPWDIMSAMNCYMYQGEFQGKYGTFGPGINTFALKRLVGIDDANRYVADKKHFSETIELSPLNQPFLAGGRYSIEIPRYDGSTYTVEYRHKAGWDRAIPFDAVLVHKEKDGLSILQHAGSNSSLIEGERFTTPWPQVHIEVVGINSYAQKATVRVWASPVEQRP